MPRTPKLEALATRGKVLVGAGIGLVVAGLCWLLREPLGGLELRLIDVRTRTYVGTRDPDPDIVVAMIQDDDIRVMEEQGIKWPWPLMFNAFAFHAMATAGVRAVAVDVYHLDRGAGPEDLPAGLTDVQKAGLVGEVDEADMLREAFEGSGRVVAAFKLTDMEGTLVPARVEAALPKLAPPIPFAGPPGLVLAAAELPISRVSRGAALLGFANAAADRDAVVRRAATVGRWKDRPVLSLPLATAILATEGDRAVGARDVRLGAATQRFAEDGTFFVNWRREHDPYVRVRPAELVLWGQDAVEKKAVPEEAVKALKGKIVVWGLSIAGQEDQVASPIASLTPGPHYQATVIDNLLHGDGRMRVPTWLNAAILFGLAAAFGVLGVMLRWRWTLVTFPISILAFVFANFRVFRGGWIVDLLFPVAAMFFTWLGTSFFRLFTEGRRNRWLEGTFGRYLSPAIIDALKLDPSKLTLGGQRREITVLFSDIAGFTKISEKLEPPQLVELLNHYLSPHAGAVMAENGVVDKFIGDAVMAFWGDPLDMPDHAVRACRTALEAVKIGPSLDDRAKELGIQNVRCRVGLNSGPAVVGNMGSAERFEYTAMGDTVNLASRLEGANKAFGSTILLGPLTYEQAKAHVVARPIGALVVVGKKLPVDVYELLAMRDGAPAEVVALADAFARAQAAAKAGDLAAARAALDECERIRPGDKPTAWFRDLLATLSGSKAWSGQVVLESK